MNDNELERYTKIMEANNMSIQMSTRRQLVAVAGVLAGTTAAAFATHDAIADESTGQCSFDAETWDEEYDVVVVGSGLAGMAAAVTVATEGEGATCLLLEKSESSTGAGNSLYSSGAIITAQDFDGYYEYMKALRGENTTVSDAICEAFVRGMMEHYDWFKSLGAPDDINVTWEGDALPYFAEYPELDTTRAACRLRFSADNPDGFTHPIFFLDAKLNEYADTVTRKFAAPARELVRDEQSGVVMGVEYEQNGQTYRAKANAGVIMCCGGFEENTEMLENYFKGYGAHPAAGLGNTGDGIVMCAKIGAKMWHMNGMAGFWPHMTSLDGMQWTTNMQDVATINGILVGINGRRFMPELVSYNGTTNNPDDLKMVQGMRHGDFNYGGVWMHIQLPSTFWLVLDTNGFVDGVSGSIVPLPMDDLVAEGWAYQSDTIEGLAEQMNVPPDELGRTVANWNMMVENGEDVAFYRDPANMRAITEAPFYAIRECPWFLNTNGGPERNENAQVLDFDDNPIPGLYAAGEFGSVWSDMYNGGGNLSECLVFGRIAARHCLGVA